MINRILIAINRAPNNRSAFESGLSLAKACNASLMLLYVLSMKEPDYPIAPIYGYHSIVEDRDFEVYQQEIIEYERQELEFLKQLASEARLAGVNIEFSLLKGNPGRMICELANTWSADLIVVGNRGFKGLKELFIGSISNYVTHHAPCSVLVARHHLDGCPAQISELATANTKSI